MWDSWPDSKGRREFLQLEFILFVETGLGGQSVEHKTFVKLGFFLLRRRCEQVLCVDCLGGGVVTDRTAVVHFFVDHLPSLLHKLDDHIVIEIQVLQCFHLTTEGLQ